MLLATWNQCHNVVLNEDFHYMINWARVGMGINFCRSRLLRGWPIGKSRKVTMHEPGYCRGAQIVDSNKFISLNCPSWITIQIKCAIGSRDSLLRFTCTIEKCYFSYYRFCSSSHKWIMLECWNWTNLI